MTLTADDIEAVKAELTAWLDERDRSPAVRKLASDVLHDLDALLIGTGDKSTMQRILADDVAELERATKH